MTGRLSLLYYFINTVYRVQAPVCDSGHVKNAIYMRKNLKK